METNIIKQVNESSPNQNYSRVTLSEEYLDKITHSIVPLNLKVLRNINYNNDLIALILAREEYFKRKFDTISNNYPYESKKIINSLILEITELRNLLLEPEFELQLKLVSLRDTINKMVEHGD